MESIKSFLSHCLILILLFTIVTPLWGQQEDSNKDKDTSDLKIEWLTFEEANKKAAKEERKIFVFITAAWCKWCEKMKNNAFSNNTLIRNVNKNYYPVKIYGNKDKRHDLVYSMLDGEVVYPTCVILNEDFERMKIMNGYYSFSKLYPIIVYYAGF